jgi:hypothetical protein
MEHDQLFNAAAREKLRFTSSNDRMFQGIELAASSIIGLETYRRSNLGHAKEFICIATRFSRYFRDVCLGTRF